MRSRPMDSSSLLKDVCNSKENLVKSSDSPVFLSALWLLLVLCWFVTSGVEVFRSLRSLTLIVYCCGRVDALDSVLVDVIFGPPFISTILIIR